uniref:SERPIN domain-containing protein n=2 Tax=Caenorhabditis japonica TaxID=281687 RepID=A0A8R1EVX2_CAEJA
MKEIPFMHSYACYRTYASDDLFEVAILDYKDPEYRFAIFLPKEKNGLTKALKKLNAARFQKLLSSAKRAYMITYIPKFTVEKKLSLDKTLPKLGITDIFSDSADLSGIADKLKISNGFHKAVMEVQEEGTDAAPEDSTKIVPYVPSQDEAVQFFATQPFVYAVLHKNHPLLLGVFHG